LLYQVNPNSKKFRYGCDEACLEVLKKMEKSLKEEYKGHFQERKFENIPFNFRLM